MDPNISGRKLSKRDFLFGAAGGAAAGIALLQAGRAIAGGPKPPPPFRPSFAQSGEDLTQGTLTQIVLETGNAAKFLPVQLLTQMIRLSDDALAEFFSRYVTGALDLYLQAKRGVQSLATYNPLTQIPMAAGDALAVGLNSDASVRRLKGPGRPVRTQEERGHVLAALAAVDAVVVFDEDTPLELIRALRPDVLVKGGDYTEATVVGAPDVRAGGGTVVIVPITPGHSTTATLEKLRGAR